MTDLLYSDIEEELRAAVRSVLDDRAPWPHVLAGTESGDPFDAKLWRTISTELGCAGLAVPEELGGAGASFREVAVVLEELGRAVAPVPFLGSSVLATAALLEAGETELLTQLAAGRRTAALAVPFSTPPGADSFTTVRVDGAAPGSAGATASGDGSRGSSTGVTLTGVVRSVADGLAADVLLVPADGALYAVDGADVRRSAVTSLDMTRPLCDLVLASAPAWPVATGDVARRSLAVALTTGAAMLSSEQLGLAERCLETTVGYLKTRYQFGRPVGSFQGLKHRLADLWVSITQARAVARYAAACVADGGADTAVATAVAQAHCSMVAVRAAEECVQLHGGIGFTWEHPAHLYLKRAKSTSIALGTPDRHRASLAGLTDLPL